MLSEERQIKDLMEHEGWVYEGTGGGCDAYICYTGTTNYLMMTGVKQECNVPTKYSDRVCIGFYIDGDCVSGVTHECKLTDIVGAYCGNCGGQEGLLEGLCMRCDEHRYRR